MTCHHGSAADSALAHGHVLQIRSLQDQRDARPTWQRAADEIRAHALHRGDLDDWTVRTLAERFEQIGAGTVDAATIPEQVQR